MEGDTTGKQSNRLCWVSWVLWALALAGLIYLVGLTVWLGVSGLVFPYQLDYGEGFLLHFVKEWSQGQPIYKGAEGYPYIMANYPPLTMVLALALTPVLGIAYAAGRVWTLLAIIALAGIIFAWVRWFGFGRTKRGAERWLPAVAVSLIFVGSPYIYHWAPLFRVDLIGLALTVGGLFAVLVAAPPRSQGGGGVQRQGLLWLAVALFVAGLYTKQSFFFAPAAALAYLFFFVDRWQAIKMAVAMAMLGGGLFVLINALTNGGFWYGLVASNVNPFLWDEFWRQQADFARTFAILGLLTVWYVVDKFLLDRKSSLRDKVSPLDLYLVAALASLWFAGKAGAWENYFFEALVAFVLCGGLGLARIARHGRLLFRIAAPLLVLAQVGLMWHTSSVASEYLALSRQSNEAIAPILADTPDPVASEDMGLLVTNGKVLDYCSFQYSQLARAGRWDEAWELGRLRDQTWSKVILEQGTRLDVDRYQRFTRGFLSELDLNYRHARTVGKYELYEPDRLQHERRAEFGDQLELVGWSVKTPADSQGASPLGQGLQPGDGIELTAVWQARQALETDYAAFAHLVDKEGRGWAGDDHQPHDGLYPTSDWGAGEMVRDTFTLIVPAGAPPGLYDVQVGWYDPATDERLPVGESTAFRVAVLPVSWAGTGAQELIPVGDRFGGAVTLEGYTWQADSEEVRVTLRWSAGAPLDSDYTVFVHLVEAETGDGAIAQGDAPPLGGRWPTLLWLPGVTLDDEHIIPLPADLPAGTYDLLVGFYDPVTGERLRLPDGRDAVRLVGVEIGD
jgi:hypothetical protein